MATPSSSRHVANGIQDLRGQGRLALGASPTHAAEQDRVMLQAWQQSLGAMLTTTSIVPVSCLTWAERSGAKPALGSPAMWPTGRWSVTSCPGGGHEVDQLLRSAGTSLSSFANNTFNSANITGCVGSPGPTNFPPGFMPCMPAASDGPATARLQAEASALALLLPQQQGTPWVVAGS